VPGAKKLAKAKAAADTEGASPASMWIARAILAICLLGTLNFAFMMEYGNRSLNTSVHHVIHAPEALSTYAYEGLDVADDLVEVGWDLSAQITKIDAAIFGFADPVKIKAASTCFGTIKTSCSNYDSDPSNLLSAFFGVVDTTSTNPTLAKCVITGYTAGMDYESLPPATCEGVAGKTEDECRVSKGTCTLGAGTDKATCDTAGGVFTSTAAYVAGPYNDNCMLHCLMKAEGCTGAQWNPNSGDESDCVLWFNDECNLVSATSYQSDASSLLYKRISTSTYNDAEGQCILNTQSTLNGIDDNVISLPAEIMDQFVMLNALRVNEVTLCVAGDSIPGAIADALGALPPLFESMQGMLTTLQTTITEQLTNVTNQLADARQQVKQVIPGEAGPNKPPGIEEWAVSTDKAGNPYPPGTDGAEYTCTALSCLDNEFDKIDENLPEINMARTALFTYISGVAMFSAVLGIAGLLLNKKLFWRLMCFLFLLWGPASLVLCAVVYGPLMMLSDTCMDVEDVTIDIMGSMADDLFATDANGKVLLINGTEISDALKAMGEMGFNFTGTVDDLVITSVPALVEHYLKGCTTGESIDSHLDALEGIAIEMVKGMAGSAGTQVDGLAAALGSDMVIRQAVLAEINKVPEIIDSKLPPVIQSMFGLIKCPRVSQAYYELKSPICCDVAVSVYWIAWPLSIMGFTTLVALILSCCIGKRAFPGKADSSEEQGRREDEKSSADMVVVDNPINNEA
jgi:hypothetical protein